jgi:hypothetical protein
VKSKVKSMPTIFFDIKRIVHKESILADQTVNSEYYYILQWQSENVQRLRPELRQQKNWPLHHDNILSHTSFFFSPGNYLPKRHDCHPPPTRLTWLGPHFDTKEVIEAELQAMLANRLKGSFWQASSTSPRNYG